MPVLVLVAIMDNEGNLIIPIEMGAGDVTMFPTSLSFIDEQLYNDLFAPPTLSERQELENA